MKTKLFTIGMTILFLLPQINSFAQWHTNGPFGGPLNTLTTSGGNIFVGTGNGVFISSDNGNNWNAANTGLERKTISGLASRGSNVFAAAYNYGVYVSSTNGATWTPKNTGLTNFYISALLAADTGLYVGTPDGIFYSHDDGNSWTLANTGIPSTYTIYSFAQMGDTVFAGSYGMGLYMSDNNGTTWTNVSAIPGSTFVYALTSFGNEMLAGTSDGVYKSSDRGVTWVASNTGFPASMWAKSFTVKPGFIFAGTYSEGVFVSTDDGSTWAPANTGIPDLPLSTGLPHNYPSVEALITNGTVTLGATAYGIFRTTDNGSTWSESNTGILSNNITALTANSSVVFAGTERDGIYSSADNGMTWMHANGNIASYDILALGTKGTSTFVGLQNENVFRSDDNGATWVSAHSGLTSDAWLLRSDSSRMLAVTSGAMFTPRGLFQTLDNGVTWTEISTAGFSDYISAIASTPTKIYAGTPSGILYFSNNNGASWSNISSGLPASIAINAILIDGTNLFVATGGMGIFRSLDNGATWTSVNIGISNPDIRDLQKNNSVLVAGSWGGGVYISSNSGASWSSNNTGLSDMFVKELVSQSGNVYAGTDAGVYSSSVFSSVATEKNLENDIKVYPNPTSTSLFFTFPEGQKITVTMNDMQGKQVYKNTSNAKSLEKIDVSGYSKGIYFLTIQTDNELFQKKIAIQ